MREMTDQADNLTRGKTEIWRREKLVMLSSLVTLPFGVALLATPLLHQPWQAIAICGFILSAAGSGALATYWAGSACPVCGRRIGGPFFRPAYHRCVYCRTSFKPEKPVSYAISLRPVPYEPGKQQENVEPEN